MWIRERMTGLITALFTYRSRTSFKSPCSTSLSTSLKVSKLAQEVTLWLVFGWCPLSVVSTIVNHTFCKLPVPLAIAAPYIRPRSLISLSFKPIFTATLLFDAMQRALLTAHLSEGQTEVEVNKKAQNYITVVEINFKIELHVINLRILWMSSNIRNFCVF
jgi:hypothetical protein